MYCRNCGKLLPDNAKFCISCGYRTADTDPAAEENAIQEDNAGHSTENNVPATRKKNLLPIILVIVAVAAIVAVLCIVRPGLMNKDTGASSKKAGQETAQESEKEEIQAAKSKDSKEDVSEKDTSKSFFPSGGEKKTDESTLFENRTKTSYLFFYDNETGVSILDSYGYVFTFGEYYPDLSSVGDNGVLAGTVGTEENDELFFLFGGSKYSVAQSPAGGITDFALSKSGEKLIYHITGEGLYSYDIDSENTKLLEEGEASDNYGYIHSISYHGSVILFSGGYMSISWINDGKPFWAVPFARFIAASDDGEHVYYNASYRTSSGEQKEDGHYENEEDSVDFCELTVPEDYDPDSGVFPHSDTIMTSESIYAGILAHTPDYSEILFGYDGDVYYYKDQQKTRLTTNALMIPAESLDPFALHYDNSWIDSLINQWHDPDPESQEYLNNETVQYGYGQYYDTEHSLKTLENQAYLQFNESTPRTVSLVWLDEELQVTTLIEDVTSDPVFSNDGTKFWCIAGTEMCCVDLSSGEPEVFSSYIGETLYNYEAPYPSPIAAGEDGETVYYLTDFRPVNYQESEYVSSADLYFMTFDAMDSPRLIDTNVIFLDNGPQGQICYLKDWDVEEEWGTLYRYNEQDGSKEQIASHVRDFYVLEGTLYYLVAQEDDYENLTLRRQWSDDSSDVVSKTVDYIEKQIIGSKGF